MLEHARPEARDTVQKLSVVDEDVVPMSKRRVFWLLQCQRPPIRHFLRAQRLHRSQIRRQASFVQLLTCAERAELQQLRVGDAWVLREELDETGLASRRRRRDEHARARLQHLLLQPQALKQPRIDTGLDFHTVEALGRRAKRKQGGGSLGWRGRGSEMHAGDAIGEPVDCSDTRQQ